MFGAGAMTNSIGEIRGTDLMFVSLPALMELYDMAMRAFDTRSGSSDSTACGFTFLTLPLPIRSPKIRFSSSIPPD